MNAMVTRADHYQLHVQSGRIPASAWTPLNEALRIVEQANELLREAEARVEEIKANARFEGLIEGRERGLRDCARAMQALVQARSVATEDLRRRAGEVAIGVVKHIAPSIGAERLVASLVAEAMQRMVFEPHLLVRIHPDIVEPARKEIRALGAAVPPDIEIIGDPELGRLDCIIESEGGVVRAGFNEQLEQTRRILAAAERGNGARHESAQD